MKRLLFLVFLFIVCLPNNAQQNSLINIHFKGKKFENLNLIMILPDLQSDKIPTKVNIAGKSENGIDWNFSYPDSLYDKHWFTRIVLQSISDTLSERIDLGTIIGSDTLLTQQFCFSRGLSDIYADYLDTRSYRKYFSEPLNHHGFYGTQIMYQFLISSQSDIQLLSSIEAICRGYSLPNKLDTISYENQIEQYEDIAGKYPDSHFLSFWLNFNLSAYKTKSDILRIYGNLSDENRSSYYGRKINNFLVSNETEYEYSKFVNSSLPVWNSGKSELIVQDTSVYNLVVFSASWCKPCHVLIPILKELNTKFKNKLIVTYISMDEEETLKEWGNLMKTEEIPWRSLLAKDYLSEMKDKYFAEGIPHTILVYPGGEIAEILNLRLERDYIHLNNLMKNNF
jgi:thiol-disulfide isomerase/thioredoxin